MIVHFDVDKYLNKLLSGKKFTTSVTSKTVARIPNKDKIVGITIKSQSFITERVLSLFPKLKLIVSRTVGVDHIDLKACSKRNIAVYHIPDYGAYNIAQHTITLFLSAARNIVAANEATHKGLFSYEDFLGISMFGKTLGVIGTGKIGLEVIRIAKSLGMRIIAFDIYENEKASISLGFSYVSLNRLLRESDVITIHLPLTAKTKHLLNNKTLKLIKKGAILVNTARGELIDTAALTGNINRFHAVCLDVIENENNFSKNNPLLKFKNVIISPHCAFFTDDSLKVIAKETEENIKRFKRGDRTNRIV